VNAIEASKRHCGSRSDFKAEKAAVLGEASDERIPGFHRGIGAGMSMQGINATREALTVKACDLQPDAREGQAGPYKVTERFVVPSKPVNAGRGKGPQFQASATKRQATRRLADGPTHPT
jgi:hypothetical protein